MKKITLTIAFIVLNLPPLLSAQSPSSLIPGIMTVIMYMPGNSDLAGGQKQIIDELVKNGPPDGTNIAVYYGGSKGTYRGLITKNYFQSEALSIENTADPETLKSYIRWSVKNSPALRYILVIWGHGHGWINYLPPVAPDKAAVLINDPYGHGFMHDDISKNEMTTSQLKNALIELQKDGIKFDVLALDVCYMATAEVIYELADTSSVIVTSEGSEYQWPYSHIFIGNFATLNNNAIGRLMVDTNLDYYKDAKKEEAHVILSAVNTKLFKDFIDKSFSPFVTQLGAGTISNLQLVSAFKSSLTFTGEDRFKDFGSLLQNMAAYTPLAKKVAADLKSSIIASVSYSDEDFLGASGVTIYAPEDKFLTGYSDLLFSQKTGWGGFLKPKFALQ